MKKIFSALAISCSLLFAVACAQKGFDRGELTSSIGVQKPVFSDKDVKEAYNKKPNLPKPFKMAVYFAQGTKNKSSRWRWESKDKEILESIGAELRAQGLLADAFPLVDSVIDGTDLRSLRVSAAKHQADALLIIGGEGATDRYINGWGWSYALLAPAFFVPGSKVDTLFITNASLWDVRNEYLYLTAEAEATSSQTYIAAFGPRDQDLLGEAKTQAVTNLKTELVKMIKGTKL